VFVISLVGIIGMAWSGYYLGAFSSRQTLSVRPFVLQRELVAYAGDAKGVVIRQETVGRRSDGTVFTRVIPVSRGLDAQELRTIILPEGVSYQISDAKKIRTKKAMGGADAAYYDALIRPSKRASAVIAGQQPPPANGKRDRAALKVACGHPGERKVGHDEMAGYPVQIWQHEALDGNQMLARLSYYRAPGLGCFPLKEVFEERQPDGSFAVRWASVPTSLLQREPDAAATDTGESYRPVSSAEFIATTQWNNTARLNLVAFGTADPSASAVRPEPASNKPDFNGRWQLDLFRSKGSGGGALPYRNVTMTLAHNEPLLDVILTVGRGNGQQVLRLALTTDGKSYTSGTATGAAWWDGQTLVLRYEAGSAARGHRLQAVRRMTLSEDGLTLHAEAAVTDAKGAATEATGAEVWQRKLHPQSYLKMRAGKNR
jgi:hypothetical protein